MRRSTTGATSCAILELWNHAAVDQWRVMLLSSSSAPVAAIASHTLLLFLLQLGLLLLLAMALGRLAVRLGMPALVGELLVGVILGPSLLAWAAPDFQRWLFP